METSLYRIEFSDGRVFKVFCANKAQKQRFVTSMQQFRGEDTKYYPIENGIHTIKQWEQIAEKL